MGWLIAGSLSGNFHSEGLAPLLLHGPLLLGVVVFAVVTLLRSRRAARTRRAVGANAAPGPVVAVAPRKATAEWHGDASLDEGIRAIRRMDPKFDPARFTGYVEMVFGSVHTARTSGDIGSLRDRVTPQLCAELQAERDELHIAGLASRVEFDIRARVTEVWHEDGRDYLTAYIVGVRRDVTTGARTDALAGSKAVPQDVESFWTFTRPAGLHPWMLSAIQPS